MKQFSVELPIEGGTLLGNGMIVYAAASAFWWNGATTASIAAASIFDAIAAGRTAALYVRSKGEALVWLWRPDADWRVACRLPANSEWRLSDGERFIFGGRRYVTVIGAAGDVCFTWNAVVPITDMRIFGKRHLILLDERDNIGLLALERGEYMPYARRVLGGTLYVWGETLIQRGAQVAFYGTDSAALKPLVERYSRLCTDDPDYLFVANRDSGRAAFRCAVIGRDGSAFFVTMPNIREVYALGKGDFVLACEGKAYYWQRGHTPVPIRTRQFISNAVRLADTGVALAGTYLMIFDGRLRVMRNVRLGAAGALVGAYGNAVYGYADGFVWKYGEENTDDCP